MPNGSITGRKTYLKVNGTNVSTYCDSVSGSNNTEEFDGTNFQPDVANPTKEIVYGFNDKRLAVTGKWSPAAETFWQSVDGEQQLEYVYGPQGHATGQVRIYGECNVGKYSGPSSNVSGVTTYSVELALLNQTVDTFDGSSPD